MTRIKHDLEKRIIDQLNEEEKGKLMALGEYYAVKTRFQYCLVAKKEDGDSANIVLTQLLQIRKEMEKQGSFEIAEIEGNLACLGCV